MYTPVNPSFTIKSGVGQIYIGMFSWWLIETLMQSTAQIFIRKQVTGQTIFIYRIFLGKIVLDFPVIIYKKKKKKKKKKKNDNFCDFLFANLDTPSEKGCTLQGKNLPFW